MATIEDLVHAKALEPVEGGLRAKQVPKRFLYLLPDAEKELDQLLATQKAVWTPKLSLTKQAISLFYDFCLGRPLNYPKVFHILEEVEDGIWELKTGDLRFFGWFPRKNHFIIASVAHATTVKTNHQYASYVSTSRFRRGQLDLDDPKFIEGELPSNVISPFLTS